MTSMRNDLGSYFHQLAAMKALQDQMFGEVQAVLAENVERLSQALGSKIDLPSAAKEVEPKVAYKFDEEEAWVGINAKVKNQYLHGFYFGLCFYPSESETGGIEVHAYGSFGVSKIEYRERLWQLVESSPKWVGERDKSSWSAELYKQVVPGAQTAGEQLRAIIDQWCEIWKGLGGVERAFAGTS